MNEFIDIAKARELRKELSLWRRWHRPMRARSLLAAYGWMDRFEVDALGPTYTPATREDMAAVKADAKTITGMAACAIDLDGTTRALSEAFAAEWVGVQGVGLGESALRIFKILDEISLASHACEKLGLRLPGWYGVEHFWHDRQELLRMFANSREVVNYVDATYPEFRRCTAGEHGVQEPYCLLAHTEPTARPVITDVGGTRTVTGYAYFV